MENNALVHHEGFNPFRAETEIWRLTDIEELQIYNGRRYVT